jgi:hypothetical protein
MVKQRAVRVTGGREGVHRTAQLSRLRHTPGLQILVPMAIVATALAAPSPAFAGPARETRRSHADLTAAFENRLAEAGVADWVESLAGAIASVKSERGTTSSIGAGGTRREWYRTDLGFAYGIPLAVLAPALEQGEFRYWSMSGRDEDVWFRFAVFGAVGLLVPPLVHIGHGNLDRAVLSVGGLAATASLGALIGYAAASPGGCTNPSYPEDGGSCRHWIGGQGGLANGVVLGLLAWSIVDVAFLAYEDVPVDPATAFSPWVSPVVTSSDRLDGNAQATSITGMQIGAAGTF